MNKVLFLDVDGVLNNGSWAAKMFTEGVYTYRDNILYNPIVPHCGMERREGLCGG